MLEVREEIFDSAHGRELGQRSNLFCGLSRSIMTLAPWLDSRARVIAQ